MLSRCLAVLLLAAATLLPARAADLTVSAAASLGDALRALAPRFEALHPGTRVRLNVAASGALLQQIAQGAPVDVFASADEATMDQAQARGLLRAEHRRNFVSNALVLVVPLSAAAPPRALRDLAGPAYARVAIGLPASVPAGRYARAALQTAGLWAAIEPKMIGAHNVRQALDYVARAEVDAGFVYATDAVQAGDRVRRVMDVPTPSPIVYPVAPVAASPNAALAAAFVDFLLTPAAQSALAGFGFGPP